MAGTFSASVAAWAEKSEAAMTDILRSSVEDLVNLASQPGLGVAHGRIGPPTQGFVPVDTGHLRNTVASDVNGSGLFGMDAENAVTLTIEQMGAGDYMHIAWTSAYAQRINSGFVGTDSLGRAYEQQGAHFVERAAENWSEIVDANAAHLKP